MGVLDVIRNWALERPRWQQMALQLLYETPQLTEEQLLQVVAVCRADFGLPGEVPTSPPLELGGTGANSPNIPVRVLGVRDVHNVNALLPAQELAFAASGLTLVFGDNGVGKTGYVRILKQACRARGAKTTVHPHAYAADTTPLSATITYQIGDAGPLQHAWTPAAGSPPALRQVSILDSHAAMVYVDGTQDIAYLPYGLDLFQRLSQVCDRVSSQLQRELAGERAACDKFADFPPTSAVADALKSVSTPTAQALIRSLRGLTDEEVEQLKALRNEESALHVGDPSKRAAELTVRKTRIQNLTARIASLYRAIDEAVGSLMTALRAESQAATEAAAAAAESTFGHFPLRGISSSAWEQLWEAAKAYATTAAVPIQRFPPETGALCVLCQQPIDASGAARLGAFDAFVREHLSSRARDARAALASQIATITNARSQPPYTPEDITELNAQAAGLGDALLQHWNDLYRRADALTNGVEPVPGLPAGLINTIAKCDQILLALQADIAVLQGSATTERLEAVRKGIVALEARMALDREWERVEAEIGRQRRISLLTEAERSTSTTGVTIKGKQLLAEAVTEPLAARLKENLGELGLNHVPIDLAPAKGEKGTVVHQVKLATAVGVPNGEILSEGEFRAVAIAGFLAEVQVQESASTLIFDDPVSSLDLGRREFVANALVGLAARRPVVVFTHDMPFAWQLVEAAEAMDIHVTERQLWRTLEATGYVADSMAASGLPARKRIGPLKQRAIGLRNLSMEDPPRYSLEVTSVYGELRKIWERGVEECLLNGAVRRFGNEVKTNSLAKLHLVTEDHMMRLDMGITKASRFLHDQAQAAGGPSIPPPEEVLADVVACEKWLTELKQLHG